MLGSKLRNQRNVESKKDSVLEQLEVNSFKEEDRIEASNDKRQEDHIDTDLGGDRLGKIEEGDRIILGREGGEFQGKFRCKQRASCKKRMSPLCGR